MKGIYFVNNQICINGLSKEESIDLQEQSIRNFMAEHNIQNTKLNPYQLNEYYTVPHALLYDLKKHQHSFDCFIHYSLHAMEDFIYTYPAKWLILKSFFKEVIIVDKQTDLTIQKVI
jgi:hypothetical protein